MIEQSVLAALTDRERLLFRAVVVEVLTDHTFIVELQHGSDESFMLADLVASSEKPVRLFSGDAVLCWADAEAPNHGLILGRIGPSIARPHTNDEPSETDGFSLVNTPEPAECEMPDSLVLEAKHSLTLRVGEGSITIREDGKILVKGKDLVSHAQRMNRIKGGAVSIN
jgi:hypothetical protein